MCGNFDLVYFRPKLFSAKVFFGQIFCAKMIFSAKNIFCAKMICSAKKYFFCAKMIISAKNFFMQKRLFQTIFCSQRFFKNVGDPELRWRSTGSMAALRLRGPFASSSLKFHSKMLPKKKSLTLAAASVKKKFWPYLELTTFCTGRNGQNSDFLAKFIIFRTLILNF